MNLAPKQKRRLRTAISAFVSAALIVTATGIAQAQPSESDRAVEFLPGYRFELSAAALADADPRFSWNAHLAGEVDVVRFGRSRINFLIDYEILLGSEYQPFDPAQGNYTLEGSLWSRFRGTDVGAVFHHVSRHLGDRPKTFGIAWNVIEGRFRRRMGGTPVEVELEGGAGWVTQRSYVDYKWTTDVIGRLSRSSSPRTTVYAETAGVLVGLTGTRQRRGTLGGGRVEFGVTLAGQAAMLDLFGGYERRIDPDQLERSIRSWPFVGFRLRPAPR